MQAINAAPWFKELLAKRQTPCISVYLPDPSAARPDGGMPDSFRAALDDARAQLGGETGYGGDRPQAALGRLEEAMNDRALWQGGRHALGVFASPDHSQVIELR